MKVKIWYTLFEGGYWTEGEINDEKGYITVTPAIAINEALLVQQGLKIEQFGRSRERFVIPELGDFPIFAFTFHDIKEQCPPRNAHVYDATLILNYRAQIIRDLEEEIERIKACINDSNTS